jgi:transposase-like protein
MLQILSQLRDCFPPAFQQSAVSIMAAEYRRYDAEFKRSVLSEYLPGVKGAGFAALAKRFHVKGGAMLVRSWWIAQKRNESLTKRTRPHRAGKLSPAEIGAYIREFVTAKNQSKVAVDYGDVQAHVKKKTGKDISLRTIQRLGRQKANLTWKQTSRSLISEGQFTLLSFGSDARRRGV